MTRLKKNVILLMLISINVMILAQDYSIGIRKVNIITKGEKYDISSSYSEFTDIDSIKQQNDYLLIKKNNNWGLISEYGRIFIPIGYQKISRKFNEFWEVQSEGKKGIFNISSSKLVIPPLFQNIDFSYRGGQEFIVRKNGFYGIMNKQGLAIILADYDKIKVNVSKKIFTLTKKNKIEYLLGNNLLIKDSLNLDKSVEINGNYIDDSKIYYAFLKNGLWGFFDEKGKEVVQPQNEDVSFRKIINGNSRQNLLLYKINNLWGLNNFLGNEIVTPKYEYFEIIAPKYAVVGDKEHKNFYNFTENKLIDTYNFNEYIPVFYKNFYYRVKNEGKESYVDNNFNLILPFKYDAMNFHEEGIYSVSKDSKWGVIDSNDKILVPLQYKSISVSCGKIIAENSNSKFGILSIDNKVLVDFLYYNVMGYSEYFELYESNSFKTKKLDCSLKCIENCNN